MAGTAVFRIVVSRDSMKKATATSQGNNFLLAAASAGTVVVSGMLARFDANARRWARLEGRALAYERGSVSSFFVFFI